MPPRGAGRTARGGVLLGARVLTPDDRGGALVGPGRTPVDLPAEGRLITRVGLPPESVFVRVGLLEARTFVGRPLRAGDRTVRLGVRPDASANWV